MTEEKKINQGDMLHKAVKLCDITSNENTYQNGCGCQCTK